MQSILRLTCCMNSNIDSQLNEEQLCTSCELSVFVRLLLPGAFPLTYRVVIQPEVCIRIGEG